MSSRYAHRLHEMISFRAARGEIWESPHWSTLWYDSAVVEPYLAQAMESRGEIGGLAPEDCTALAHLWFEIIRLC